MKTMTEKFAPELWRKQNVPKEFLNSTAELQREATAHKEQAKEKKFLFQLGQPEDASFISKSETQELLRDMHDEHEQEEIDYRKLKSIHDLIIYLQRTGGNRARINMLKREMLRLTNRPYQFDRRHITQADWETEHERYYYDARHDDDD